MYGLAEVEGRRHACSLASSGCTSLSIRVLAAQRDKLEGLERIHRFFGSFVQSRSKVLVEIRRGNKKHQKSRPKDEQETGTSQSTKTNHDTGNGGVSTDKRQYACLSLSFSKHPSPFEYVIADGNSQKICSFADGDGSPSPHPTWLGRRRQ